MSNSLPRRYKKTLSFVSFAIIVTIFLVTPNYNPNLRPIEPRWKYNTGDYVFDIDIALEGSYTVVGTGSSILLFHKSNSAPIWDFEPVNGIKCVSISSNGEYFAGVDRDKLYLFRREGKIITNSIILNESYYVGWNSVDVSLNGKYFVATHYKTLYLFSTTTLLPIWNYTSDNIFHDVQISADGSFLAAGDSNFIYMFSKSNNNPLWKYALNFSNKIVISSDGRYLVAKSWNYLYLFKRNSPIPIWMKDLCDSVGPFSMSPDGSYILAGCKDGTVYLFRTESANPLWIYHTTWPIGSLSISKDGKKIAVASTISYVCALCAGCPCPPSQGEMYFFSGSTLKNIKWRNMGGYIYSCAITSDGSSVLVGCADNKIYSFQN